MIGIYGVNLKGLPCIHKYLKMQTQLYVSKKSKTFDAKQIHHILTVLQDSDEPKKNLEGVATALLYHGLLRINEAKKLIVDDVTIKSDPKESEVTFYHAKKEKWGVYVQGNCNLLWHVCQTCKTAVPWCCQAMNETIPTELERSRQA